MFRLLSEILLAERPAVRAGRDGGNARSLRGSPHGDRPIQPVPRVRAPMELDMGSGVTRHGRYGKGKDPAQQGGAFGRLDEANQPKGQKCCPSQFGLMVTLSSQS